MDDAEIVATIEERNALRREAQLPALNIELELTKARLVEAGRVVDQRYAELCQTYAKERQDIRNAAIREARERGDSSFPSNHSSFYGLHLEVEKRFKSFLSEEYQTIGALS
ncbi:hypothetical protein FV219_03870 [Methylobacterium sp. WL122]|nr:hypothetical protein FV219_03870 [Methylobacterium sp. WL122]